MDTQDRRHSGQPKEDIASVENTKPVIDTFGILVFLVVVVEIVLVVGLNMYQQSRIESLTTKLQEANTELRLPENATLNTQVSEVLAGGDKLKNVLDSRVRWSKFYTLLNGITPKNVKLTGLTIADSGAFRAEGNTSSLSDLARLIVAWRDGTTAIPTPFTSVSLNSNGFSDSGGKRVVTFSISGSVNTGVLK
ncbi:MAG: hypothetical protein Q7K33_03150 [Candidatus Berkelbacteria bacterium]|nr:hypothetical protein [Candidatus Berkelbacteria bacterium]